MPSRPPALPLHDLMREALLDAARVRDCEPKVTRLYLNAVAERLRIAPPDLAVLVHAIGGVAHVERGIAGLLHDVRRELLLAQRLGPPAGK